MASQEIPGSISGDPALLFLYNKVEEAAGIRAGDEQLIRLKKYLEERCGVPYRQGLTVYQEMLESREGLLDLAPFFTVNETYFFREGVHFRLLFRHLLPFLAGLRRPVRICSAATSSGCEAYSIAMTVDFYCRNRILRGGGELSWELDAFDLNPEMIDAARRGRYGSGALREDGAWWKPVMDLYLRPGGNGFEIAEVLRDKVRFFTHNIMDGLAGSYDLIFFRNALIYFSPENRRKILGILFKALKDGGSLIVGVSETSSVDEPGLRMSHRMGAFYYVKEDAGGGPLRQREAAVPEAVVLEAVVPKSVVLEAAKAPVPEAASSVPVETPVEMPPVPGARLRTAPAAGEDGARAIPEIAGILEQDEGKANAARVLGILGEGAVGGEKLGFAGLAAAALSLMGAGDLSSAGLVISSLEKRGSSPVVSFLRGEFYYQGADFSLAEAKYQEAAAAESGFWPALYRAGSLAEGGNATRYRYRLKKALESMEKGAGCGYEVFIGGFSPDYYRRILEKKLAL